MHGQVRADGSNFEFPLVGQGYTTDSRLWRRLLTFNPDMTISGGSVSTLVIDVPTTFAVQEVDAAGTAGKIVQRSFNVATAGSLFTRIDLRTSGGQAHGCDFVKRDPDHKLCDNIDPTAAVAIPN